MQVEALPKLFSLISVIASNWKLFSLQIGVPHYEILQIQARTPGSMYTCFNQALQWWIDNVDNPVYESIIDTLENHPPVMNRALASKVKKFMAEQQGEPFTVVNISS